MCCNLNELTERETHTKKCTFYWEFNKYMLVEIRKFQLFLLDVESMFNEDVKKMSKWTAKIFPKFSELEFRSTQFKPQRMHLFNIYETPAAHVVSINKMLTTNETYCTLSLRVVAHTQNHSNLCNMYNENHRNQQIWVLTHSYLSMMYTPKFKTF